VRRSDQGVCVRSKVASRLMPVVVACGLLSGGLIAGCSSPAHQADAPVHVAPTTTKPTVGVRAVPKPVVAPQPVGVLVAWAKVSSLPVYSTPGRSEPAQSLANPNNLGAPLVVLVNNLRRGWVQAYLPERPNESLGWIPMADVTMVRDPDRIVVNLSTRHLELFRGDKIAFQTVVAVGSPTSPTPTGHFYVTERIKVADPENSPYGPYALGLSGFSNVYKTFDGGPGQIAIHGTDEPWFLGQYASHGCVRLSNAEITALVGQVETGTPVDITD
jgi:lipoprotein-anchoring transpeptidase ErfK/SrfK